MSHVPDRPCRGCPWVVGSDPGSIPGFDLDQAEALAATCPDVNGMRPEFSAPVMACHHSREGKDFVCAGWAATAGAAHPAMRLNVLRGSVDPGALAPRPGWPELYPDFQAMITHLRESS